MNGARSPALPAMLLALVAVAMVASGIRPYDRLTWVLEVLPVLIAAPLLLVTSRRLPLTLIESWAAVKSMRRRDGGDEPPGPGRNPTVDFHGERRTNETHVAPHDPEAKLYRKSRNAPAKRVARLTAPPPLVST